MQKCYIFVNFDKYNLLDILLLLLTFLIFNLVFNHFSVIFHIFFGKYTLTYLLWRSKEIASKLLFRRNDGTPWLKKSFAVVFHKKDSSNITFSSF